MVVVGDVQPIIDRVVQRTRALRLGEDMGPVISGAAVQRICGHIDEAQKRGVKVLVDGRGACVEGAPGFWVGPRCSTT